MQKPKSNLSDHQWTTNLIMVYPESSTQENLLRNEVGLYVWTNMERSSRYTHKKLYYVKKGSTVLNSALMRKTACQGHWHYNSFVS